MKFVIGLLLSFFVGTASAGVITESDLGLIFSDNQCEIISYELLAVDLYGDEFDYLTATANFGFTCVDRNGLVWRRTGFDTVIFPTIEFDWRTQHWMWGTTPIARRGRLQRAELLENFGYRMWSNNEEGLALAFRVQILRVEEK